ncbi:YciI family protein [Glycomyces xiaoerkulensis]|uniref:YciI family protein n=1 Tax=Glycomyces xiaoerkulensis TaxID=2038139 RepID=UPI000C257B13|nr:hypothetical protein [Glycomyces xiaoerkulensis]
MFIVLLRIGDKAKAAEHMHAHLQWIADGFADRVFLLTGNLESATGGAVIAHRLSRTELERRLDDDPLVAHRIAEPDIIEIAPGRVDERLGFLQEA